MQTNLLTYAMIRTLYDRGKDYIDSFWPFALLVLSAKATPLSLEEIKGAVSERYGLEIPKHSLSVILTRAKKEGLITQQRHRYNLTEAGRKYAAELETEPEVNRRINELLDEAQTFLHEKEAGSFSVEEIRQLIEAFAREHIEFFVNFIDPSQATPAVGLRDKALQRHEAHLLEYFQEVERGKPTLFSTLRDIILGSLISAILHSRSFADATQKFGETLLFLDTNFVFSLFELHFEQYSRPARELVELIKSDGSFELRVFDFTVDELVGVLRGYQREQHQYVRHLEVDSIYSSIKAKGWSPADVREFIVKIEEKLWGLGINVQKTGVELSKYEPQGDGVRSCLQRSKPNQGVWGQNHDLAAIEQIEKIRKGTVRQIERSKAIFLTSDTRLARYDLLERSHRERGTVTEVVLDRVLTNLLWLKNPTLIKSVPLTSIIAMHSRELFIDRAVWERFSQTLRELRSRGEIADVDISVLLYDQRIGDTLRSLTRDDLSGVTSSFVLSGIEGARRRLEEARAAERETWREEMAAQRRAFDTEIAEAEQDKVDRLLETLEEAKRSLRAKAERWAGRVHMGTATVVGCGLVGGSIVITPWVVKQWNIIEPVVWVVSMVLWGLVTFFGYKEDWFGWGARLRNWLFNALYRQMLHTSEIERIERSVVKGT